MKLEHLAPYLPYGLKCRTKIGDLFLNRLTNCETFKAWFVYTYDSKNNLVKHNYEANTSNDNTCGKGFRLNEIKPILRPLTDLTKEIERKGKKSKPIWDLYSAIIEAGENPNIAEMVLNRLIRKEIDVEMLPYFVYLKLLEWHFDVFGLIEKGEAIDINTL